MDDDVLAQFTSITGATPERASQYLRVTEGNLEQAVQLYFESDGVDMEGSAVSSARPAMQPAQLLSQGNHAIIDVDSDNDERPGLVNRRAGNSPPLVPSRTGISDEVEDDEAMARRLQQEAYGGIGNDPSLDPEDVRAPMARQSQTLLGPDSDWRDDPEQMRAAIAEQLRTRRGPQTGPSAGPPGIFNQRPPPSAASIWDNGNNPDAHRRNLARATAGASESSSKSNLLAEMYRPPFEIMSPLITWEAVRNEGKNEEKWILINFQDPNIFDCQVLNRDIWKNEQIQETVKENFLFKQYMKHDPQAETYVRFYFQAYESMDAYPHIAIVDPRTGEQMKVWSGLPAPKPIEFLTQLHEFLDRYSLKANIKNPVARRKPEAKKELNVDKMSEEEMLEMALQNSLGATPGPKEEDPDVLTKSVNGVDMGKAKVTDQQPAAIPVADAIMTDMDECDNSSDGGVAVHPFSNISTGNPHTEPAADAPNTSRIQFRHPGGRVIRRFSLTDSVRRMYEWLKASPMEGKEGVDLELIFMGKNLMPVIDQTIEEAGLKNGSVMVEFIQK